MNPRSISLYRATGLALAALSLPLHAEEKDGIVLAQNGPPAPGTTIEWSYYSESKLSTTVQVKDREGSKDRSLTTEKQGRLTTVSPSKLQLEITGIKKTRGDSAEASDSFPLKGIPLVIEKKNDQWAIHKKDGSELSKEENKDISGIDPIRGMESDWLIFGGSTHKPGDQWRVDASKLSVFGTLAHPTGTVAVEFVEVTKLGIIDYAILKTKIDVEGTDINSGLKSHAKGDSTQRRSLVDLITLDAKSTGTLEYSGKNSAGEELHGSGTTESMLRNSTQSP